MILLAGIIGILTGLASVLLKTSVHAFQHFLTSGFDYANSRYLYLAYPLVGIVLTLLLAKYVFKDRLGHGITDILYSISKNFAVIRRVKMISRMVTSAVTVGLGGSVGLEAPIVVTGSAIGSNVGRFVHLDYRKRTTLIGCGAAGAISAIFNSPIAGVIFAAEVILTEMRLSALIPILIASVGGSIVSLTLLGDDVLFAFQLQDAFTASDVPYFILLGVLCGLVSVYFTHTTYRIESFIHRIQSDLGKAITGGILLGVIIFAFPPIYGEGYNTIKLLLSGQENLLLDQSLLSDYGDSVVYILLFGVGVMLIKPVASAITIGSGGSGGIFAPSLFVGGMTGFLFAKTVNQFADGAVSTSNFTLVGMCGVMSGVLHAPLTAIFLIAEITSGYTLFVPLMLVSAIAYTANSYFQKHSLYTKHLIEQGDIFPGNKDYQVLNQITISKIIEKDLLAINENSTLEELVDLVKQSKRNIFPVVNDDNQLLGIITLDDIREIMFDESRRKEVHVKSLMRNPPDSVSPHENMQSVMSKFETTGAWNLPVIDEGEYVGFISKARIFNSYRKNLIFQSKE